MQTEEPMAHVEGGTAGHGRAASATGRERELAAALRALVEACGAPLPAPDAAAVPVSVVEAARRVLDGRGERRADGRKPTLTGDALAMARELRRAGRSFRVVGLLLAEAGHVNPETGRPYSAPGVRDALAR